MYTHLNICTTEIIFGHNQLIQSHIICQCHPTCVNLKDSFLGLFIRQRELYFPINAPCAKENFMQVFDTQLLETEQEEHFKARLTPTVSSHHNQLCSSRKCNQIILFVMNRKLLELKDAVLLKVVAGKRHSPGSMKTHIFLMAHVNITKTQLFVIAQKRSNQKLKFL